jgi:hypothetical protein
VEVGRAFLVVGNSPVAVAETGAIQGIRQMQRQLWVDLWTRNELTAARVGRGILREPSFGCGKCQTQHNHQRFHLLIFSLFFFGKLSMDECSVKIHSTQVPSFVNF